MRSPLRSFVVILLLAAMTACGGGTPGQQNTQVLTAPTWDVTGPILTVQQFAALAKELGLPAEAFQPEAFARHTDPDTFLDVPRDIDAELAGEDEEETTLSTRRFDFDAIKAMGVADPVDARIWTADALANANLLQQGPYKMAAFVEHARFGAGDVNGNEIVDVDINTQVGYEFELDEIPVIGPGAKVRVVYNADGSVAQMTYAIRPVERGADVAIRSAAEAQEAALARFLPVLDTGGSDLQVQCRLVYYAPRPEIDTVQTIFPHYEVNGSFLSDGSSVRTNLRTIMLPAIQSAALPTVMLQTSFDGQDVSTHVEIKGGTPPFQIGWASTTTLLGKATEGKTDIMYPLGTSPLPNTSEIVGVSVTDSNGLTVSASGTVATVAQAVPPPVPDDGILDHGSEWVGVSQGLDNSGRNATRFVRIMEAASIARFNWGDYQTAERRFKDIALGGSDSLIGADSVDITFYTGHANGNGWSFPTNFDRGALAYPVARYGDGDLEWLIIAACGPMQDIESDGAMPTPQDWTLYERWGRAFQGLHLLGGYANVSKDNTMEGQYLATRLLAGWTVRQAWFQAAIDTQGRAQLAGIMGVLGPGWINNFDDHFHGRGSVGPDITTVTGYWHIYMNCR